VELEESLRPWTFEHDAKITAHAIIDVKSSDYDAKQHLHGSRVGFVVEVIFPLVVVPIQFAKFADM
jgi:hypothetical protein